MKRKISLPIPHSSKKAKTDSYEYLSELNQKQHPRNREWMPEKPNFTELAEKYPKFAAFTITKKEKMNVQWKKEGVLHALAEVLLAEFFDIKSSFPLSHLAPTLGLRTNYLHWISDLLDKRDHQKEEGGDKIVFGIDIGTGASCIYPLLGKRMYDWSFLATDIDPDSIESANENINRNEGYSQVIQTLLVPSNGERKILSGVIPDKRFDFCLCNPPFFDSLEKTQLNPKRKCEATKNELVTPGGEFSFVKQMIDESLLLQDKIRWYTSMLGRKESFRKLRGYMRSKGDSIQNITTTEFCQGRQVRWAIAWQVQSVMEEGTNE